MFAESLKCKVKYRTSKAEYLNYTRQAVRIFGLFKNPCHGYNSNKKMPLL